jgi:hypothetical protein
VGGSATQIGSFSHALNAGDWIGLAAISSSISTWYSTDGTSWSLVGEVGDGAAVNASGYCGVETNDTGGTVRWDNFGAGSVPKMGQPHRMPLGV